MRGVCHGLPNRSSPHWLRASRRCVKLGDEWCCKVPHSCDGSTPGETAVPQVPRSRRSPANQATRRHDAEVAGDRPIGLWGLDALSCAGVPCRLRTLAHTALICRVTPPPSAALRPPLPQRHRCSLRRRKRRAGKARPRRTSRTGPSPNTETPAGASRRGFLTSHLLSQASHQQHRRSWTTHKALTCAYAPDPDHLDRTRRDLQPVPCGTQRGAQYEYGGVVGSVDPVLQGLLAHPPTLPTL